MHPLTQPPDESVMSRRLYGSQPSKRRAQDRYRARPLTAEQIEQFYAAVDQAMRAHGKPQESIESREFRTLCWQFERRIRRTEL